MLFLNANHVTAQSEESYRLVFWNVENLFDCTDDSTRNDDAFTPAGERHWTPSRYRNKLNNLCRSIVAMGDISGTLRMPLLIGMAEVENDKVLRDLCQGTPLRRFGYSFIHFDSPDPRGIDNALLYIKKDYNPFLSQAISVSDSAKGIATRDILLVEGTTSCGDTIIVLVNHFPSRLGGEEAEMRREHAAKTLRRTMDSLRYNHPCAAIIVMGDYNATADEHTIRNIVMHGSTYTNLMEKADKRQGSYKYQDHWSYIDQIIVSNNLLTPLPCSRLQTGDSNALVFNAPFLLIADEKYMGEKVFRTYLAMKYEGGYSDHLPVFVDLFRR